MKFSLLIASGVIAVVAIVGASAYNQRTSYRSAQQANGQYYNHNGCGYNCQSALRYYSKYQQPGARSVNGPYHSYAVRPAIYGGYGMYHYKGYARHPLPPANAHYRRVRSHAAGNNYATQTHHYGLRPVKALVLAPAYSGNGSGSRQQSSGHYGAASRHHRSTRSHPKAYGRHQQARGAYGAGSRNARRPNAGHYNRGQRQHYGSARGGATSYRHNKRGGSKSHNAGGGY